MVDDHPPSTYAPSGAFPTFGFHRAGSVAGLRAAHEHCAPHRDRVPPRAGERDLRDGGVRARHRAPEPARGAGAPRRPRRAYRAAADGRPGALHLDGSGRDHGLGDPARCDRRAAPLGPDGSAALEHGLLPDRVRDPDLPLRRPRRARPESGRAPEGGDARGRARGARSTGSPGSRIRSCGCCRSRRTSCCACCG